MAFPEIGSISIAGGGVAGISAAVVPVRAAS